ncbi:hypothetical protein BDK51DRAFT_35596 [Blyttiomyces helicus]|uniref:Ankyrin repeat protein nuc-2 n=1 Tax=Blyttiomyces helicus TaxID=388810 RepID=A0A4V1IQZ7_9FUNG|nr:hypothetical protein BDK51DRAFT_35596 [Blyttiomyces helicus]|eukprot:RKO88297.1 hypothetical protein BDK51DRAFT_35596 [Blyttiomyces helicus]
MKFGKYIQAQADWAGPHYLNYKGLKKIINSVEPPTDAHATFTTLAAINPPGVAGSADDVSLEFQALKTAFFFKLERELEKVNAFYLQKEAEFKVRLKSLVHKKRILQTGKGRQTQASLVSLKEAFSQFQHDLTKLQKFVEVNATGFRKILKKWDKRSKSSTKELYLSRQIEIQPCFNNDVLAELTDQATTNFAELDSHLASEETEAATRISDFRHGTEALEDTETELYRFLAENDAAAVAEFLQKRKAAGATGSDPASPSSADDKDLLSRIFLRFCAESTIECLTLLAKSGEVDSNFVDDISDRSCLHETAIAGRFDVLQLSVEIGAKVEGIDVYGRKALHYAAMYGHSDCALFLISTGTVVDSLDHDGCTPLVYSITGGHTKCVETLIVNGALVEPQSPMAPIPLSLACQHGHRDIVTLLLSKGAQLILNAEGLYPLHLTSREGHHAISRLLIAHGAPVNARDHCNGWTPIFYSASEGHLDCVKVLIDAGCRIDDKDDRDWLPWTYALYRGHINVARLVEVPSTAALIEPPAPAAPAAVSTEPPVRASEVGIKPMAPSRLFIEDTEMDSLDLDLDIDAIPSLSLPPPIIPFRIYGHAFLDKKCYVQVTFASLTNSTTHDSPISLFSSRQLSSLKMLISSKPEVGLPYTVILPLQDEAEVYTFLVDDLSTFSLQFDIFPTFGTKPLGRAVALPSQLLMTMGNSWSGAGASEKCICPLFDTHLRVVGELSFGFAIVKPFIHPSLQIGGKVETYWKSTKVVSNTKSSTDHGIQSFITASSLAEEYIQVVLQVTKDRVPVVYPVWHLPIEGFDLGVANVTLAQGRALFTANRQGASATPNASATALSSGERLTCDELAKAVYDSFLTLEEVLTTLPTSVGVSIVIKYPTDSERNALSLSALPDIDTVVDTILQTVYDHASQRSIIFSSFNPSICTAVNWKQPNYGVFFGTRCGFSRRSVAQGPGVEGIGGEEEESDRRCNSIKEAIHFAKAGNLLGVICEATPLTQVPILINTIKESGLILASIGSANEDPVNVRLQEGNGVDAIIRGNVLRYCVK